MTREKVRVLLGYHWNLGAIRSLMLNLTLSTLCTIGVCVRVSWCIQTSFIRQLGTSECGGLLNATKIEMLNFGENPLAVRTVSCPEVTLSKGEVISLWQCSSWRVGKKSKYMNRKRHPVQTVQKKEGLKSGKVPKHKKPDFNLWKNSTQHLRKSEAEMSQMTQLLSRRQSVRPDRKKKSAW